MLDNALCEFGSDGNEVRKSGYGGSGSPRTGSEEGRPGRPGSDEVGACRCLKSGDLDITTQRFPRSRGFGSDGLGFGFGKPGSGRFGLDDPRSGQAGSGYSESRAGLRLASSDLKRSIKPSLLGRRYYINDILVTARTWDQLRFIGNYAIYAAILYEIREVDFAAMTKAVAQSQIKAYLDQPTPDHLGSPSWDQGSGDLGSAFGKTPQPSELHPRGVALSPHGGEVTRLVLEHQVSVYTDLVIPDLEARNPDIPDLSYCGPKTGDLGPDRLGDINSRWIRAHRSFPKALIAIASKQEPWSQIQAPIPTVQMNDERLLVSFNGSATANVVEAPTVRSCGSRSQVRCDTPRFLAGSGESETVWSDAVSRGVVRQGSTEITQNKSEQRCRRSGGSGVYGSGRVDLGRVQPGQADLGRLPPVLRRSSAKDMMWSWIGQWSWPGSEVIRTDQVTTRHHQCEHQNLVSKAPDLSCWVILRTVAICGLGTVETTVRDIGLTGFISWIPDHILDGGEREGRRDPTGCSHHTTSPAWPILRLEEKLSSDSRRAICDWFAPCGTLPAKGEPSPLPVRLGKNAWIPSKPVDFPSRCSGIAGSGVQADLRRRSQTRSGCLSSRAPPRDAWVAERARESQPSCIGRTGNSAWFRIATRFVLSCASETQGSTPARQRPHHGGEGHGQAEEGDGQRGAGGGVVPVPEAAEGPVHPARAARGGLRTRVRDHVQGGLLVLGQDRNGLHHLAHDGRLVGAQLPDVGRLRVRSAVKVFTRNGQVQLGSELDIAVGPIGRAASAALNVGPGGIAPNYSYSHSKGLYGGIGLSGGVICTRKSLNAKCYGPNVTARQLLGGEVACPLAEPLWRALDKALGMQREYVNGFPVLAPTYTGPGRARARGARAGKHGAGAGEPPGGGADWGEIPPRRGRRHAAAGGGD
ncbi:hypothetical protein ON010_g12107 [Phytophthora cinnamomi]|nr:hypothetical protein ON010_g12107 [Phytophthora cinnamomi]